jgi:hypothetical protein
MSEIVTYEGNGRVALITLNRPEARNAVNGEVARAMESAIDQMESDENVWVGIIQANTEGHKRLSFVRALISKRSVRVMRILSRRNVADSPGSCIESEPSQ